MSRGLSTLLSTYGCHVSPSSLIFVAVVAVWAAYLVVHTTRRREYLATARTVDRFSASMRVLQRRAVRRETAEAFEASTAPMRRTSSMLLHKDPTAVSRAAVEARAAVAAQAPLATANVGGASGLAARQRAAVRRRRARVMGVAALGFVAVAVITAVLAGFGLVSWFAPAAGALLAVGLVALMRQQAIAARAERHGRVARPARSGSTAVEAASLATEDAAVVEARTEAQTAASPMPVAQEFVPFDYAREVEPAIAAEAQAQFEAQQWDPLHGRPGWEPVPVPPPTYTLKARAERPVPPPLEVEYDYERVEEWVETDEVYYRAAGQ